MSYWWPEISFGWLPTRPEIGFGQMPTPPEIGVGQMPTPAEIGFGWLLRRLILVSAGGLPRPKSVSAGCYGGIGWMLIITFHKLKLNKRSAAAAALA